MEKTTGKAASPTASRLPETGKTRVPPLRLLGHQVSLARDVADLEACLSLERGLAPSPSPDFLAGYGKSPRGRRPAARPGACVGLSRDIAPNIAPSPSLAAGRSHGLWPHGDFFHSLPGLESPSAVPYCEFLLVRDAEGALAGLCRLLSHGPDVPVRHPLAPDRFRLSPLLTAIRYSRLELLEAGPLRVAPGRDPARIRALLWAGIRQVMERGKAAILLGRERLDGPIPGDGLARLMAAYALPPDLAVEARDSFALGGGYAPEAFSWSSGGADRLPDSLREALQRGCRLAGEPVGSPDGLGLELTWVATGEMLTG